MFGSLPNLLWTCLGFFIGQLTTSCIDIFSTAATKTCIYFILFEITHELCHALFGRLFKPGKINWVVFNNIYQISRHLAINFNQFIRVFLAIIKVVKKNVLECDLILCLTVK